MNNIDALELLKEGSWPTVVGIIVIRFFALLFRIYHDSFKSFLGSYFEIKLNVFRNRLDLQLCSALITGAYSKIENEIVSEVIRIYAINDRFSEIRQKQIPSELRRAASRGISSVIPDLMKYQYAKTGARLADPLNQFRSSVDLTEQFWKAITVPIFTDKSNQARYATISKVGEQVELAREKALSQIQKK